MNSLIRLLSAGEFPLGREAIRTAAWDLVNAHVIDMFNRMKQITEFEGGDEFAEHYTRSIETFRIGTT